MRSGLLKKDELLMPHPSHRCALRRTGGIIAVLFALLVLAEVVPAPAQMRGLAGYLSLHTALEILAVVMAMLIFVVGWNAFRFNFSRSVMLISCGFLGVGILDFAHMISYPGMPEFITHSDTEKAINFWLAARFLGTVTLLVVALLPWQREANRAVRSWSLLAVLALVAAIHWLVLYHGDVLPQTFIPGEGLTPFKVYMEYLLVFLNLATALILWSRMRGELDFDAPSLFGMVLAAAMSEYLFTLYADVTDVFNLLGHIYKAIAYFFLYRAIFVTNVQSPYEQLQATLEALPDMLYELGMDGRCHAHHLPRHAARMGLPEEMVGPDFFAKLPDEARQTLLAAMREAQESGYASGGYEWASPGGRRWFDFSVSRKNPAPDTAPCFIVLVRDVTELKEKEFSLNASQERLHSIIETEPECVKLLNQRGELLEMNAAGLMMLEADNLEEAKRRALIDYVLPEYRRAFIDLHEQVMAGRQGRLEFEIEGLKGRRRWLETHATPLKSAKGEETLLLAVTRDISERKQVEQDLRDSEARLRTILDSVDAYIYLKDIDGHYLFANRAARDLWQVELKDLIGYGDEAFFDEASAENIQSNDRRVLLGGETIQAEEVNTVLRTGETFIYLSTKLPLRHEDGDIYALCGISFDITERKSAEDALRESEKNLNEAQSLAHLGSYILDVTRGEWRSSAVLDQLFGIDSTYPHDVAGWLTLIHPDDQGMMGRYLQEEVLGKGVAFDKEYRITRHNDGAERWVHGLGMVERDADGNPLMMHGTIQDITERKHAEDEIRKLSLAVEQSLESIIITNLDAKIEYVNEAFLNVTGYSREEVLGQNPSILRSERTPDESYVQMWECLVQGRPWRGEFYNRRKDGSEYVEFAVITPLRQPDGRISHYVAVKEDITEKKRAEQELDSYRHHLEELVGQRTSELDAALLRAESANKAKSNFLANMSHEIRTPMNAILGLAHLLQREGVTPAQQERLNKISASGEHLLSIINDILDLSKIEAGKLVLEKSDFHLAAVLDHVSALISDSAKAKGLRVEIDHGGVPVWLCGDKTRLRQALLNLAGNAVKFTTAGTILLRARLLCETREGLEVRFEVQDTGIGIPKERLSQLFQPFEQTDGAITRKYGGTGLGLSITRNLAELMGGEVGVESTPGEGSTFWFKVVLQRGQGIMPASMQTGDEPKDSLGALRQLGSLRILLAEDNEINREVAKELLRGTGIVVDTAEDGRKAVEMVEARSYDLILMDIQMPEMDGFEAARMIRAIPERQHIPIVAMSANVFEEDRRLADEAGMKDYIAKPVVPVEFYATLLKWLSGDGQGSTRQVNEGVQEQESEVRYPAALNAFEGIDLERALGALRGNVGKYLRFLRLLMDGHIDDVSLLRGELAAGQYEEAMKRAHGLKGASATLGVTVIQQAAEDIEMALRGQLSQEHVVQLLPPLDEALASVSRLLEQLAKEGIT